MEKTEIGSKWGYIWNAAAGMINAAEAVVMSMIVTRLTGLADAGILSIAFAIGNLLMPIGKFALRNYQITDVEERFSFAVYVKSRIVTVMLMVVSTFGYLGYAALYLGYDRNKMGIIFAVCMIYAVEAVEDVVWGYYQHRNRLDVGAKLFCIRWLGILSLFPLILYITRNLQLTLMFCFLLSVLIFLFLLRTTYYRICCEADRHIRISINRAEFGQIGKLLWITFPLCAISFLSFYVNNAPKYAIDACLTDEIQACYGFVSMPVFVVKLLSNFIYHPVLVPMAVEWDGKRIKEFTHRIANQMMIIAGLSVICLLGAYVLGIPVLSLLYDTDLSGYKTELMVLLSASGFMAVSAYLTVVLTVMRCQKELLWPCCLVALIAAVSLKTIVSLYGTLGASICYLVLMVLLCLLYMVILAQKLWKASLD